MSKGADTARIEQAFLRACHLDVAVRKPGNVSAASPGHGMRAADFLRSAAVSAPCIADPQSRVGERVERAVAATWAAVGCNTNLGILLLCAPLARAAQAVWRAASGDAVGLADATAQPILAPLPPRVETLDKSLPANADVVTRAQRLVWQQALHDVVADLDVVDAQAAFRAIAQAQPGGLGAAPQQDVRTPATVTLREAMALAADRDRIARQYAEGFSELWSVGLATVGPIVFPRAEDLDLAVQRVYLAWLASGLDSHLVRKHGQAVAHSVTREAQQWQARALQAQQTLDQGPWAVAWAGWDEDLKRKGWNPGSCADLTVATLFLLSLVDEVQPGATNPSDLARIV